MTTIYSFSDSKQRFKYSLIFVIVAWSTTVESKRPWRRHMCFFYLGRYLVARNVLSACQLHAWKRQLQAELHLTDFSCRKLLLWLLFPCPRLAMVFTAPEHFGTKNFSFSFSLGVTPAPISRGSCHCNLQSNVQRGQYQLMSILDSSSHSSILTHIQIPIIIVIANCLWHSPSVFLSSSYSLTLYKLYLGS